jgi:hypothetical protein
MLQPKFSRLRLFTLVFGGLLLLFSLYNLDHLWRQPVGIWWTPSDQTEPLTAAENKFQVSIRGIPLGQLIRERRLQLAGDATLAEGDIGVRFNHYDQVLVTKIPALIVFGAGAGASLIVILIGLLAPALARPTASRNS